ncbi:MAG: hypothetical protein ACK5HZ_00445 [Macellibacteroides fermentans]|uniref:hypothetical protein n=1 Tax=Macellibacteroides fermentans TaxID=879969 RepID=UPI003ABF4248
MIKGIITGDLVNSTDIAVQWRSTVKESLNAVLTDMVPLTTAKLEIYRGDSFQVLVDQVEHVLSVAIALRTKLRATTPENCEIWDARVSIGIGEVTYESETIVTSDGEAFRLSGRSFDQLGKKRLALVSPWNNFNEAIDLNTRFADDIISSLTTKQARVVYHSLLSQKKQKDMAKDLGMTNQNFNKLWLSSRGQLISDYIGYFKTLIEKHNPQ